MCLLDVVAKRQTSGWLPTVASISASNYHIYRQSSGHTCMYSTSLLCQHVQVQCSVTMSAHACYCRTYNISTAQESPSAQLLLSNLFTANRGTTVHVVVVTVSASLKHLLCAHCRKQPGSSRRQRYQLVEWFASWQKRQSKLMALASPTFIFKHRSHFCSACGPMFQPV